MSLHPALPQCWLPHSHIPAVVAVSTFLHFCPGSHLLYLCLIFVSNYLCLIKRWIFWAIDFLVYLRENCSILCWFKSSKALTIDIPFCGRVFPPGLLSLILWVLLLLLHTFFIESNLKLDLLAGFFNYAMIHGWTAGRWRGERECVSGWV